MCNEESSANILVPQGSTVPLLSGHEGGKRLNELLLNNETARAGHGTLTVDDQVNPCCMRNRAPLL